MLACKYFYLFGAFFLFQRDKKHICPLCCFLNFARFESFEKHILLCICYRSAAGSSLYVVARLFLQATVLSPPPALLLCKWWWTLNIDRPHSWFTVNRIFEPYKNIICISHPLLLLLFSNCWRYFIEPCLHQIWAVSGECYSVSTFPSSSLAVLYMT